MNYPFTFWLSALNTWSIAQRLPIEHWCVRYSGQSPWRQDADWKDWTEPTARFRELETEAHVPWPNAVLLANVRGETLLKVNGGAAYGFNPYHRQYSPKVIAGTNVQLGLEQVPMGLMGSESDHPGIVSFEWALVDPVARACYWDLAVLLEWGEDPAVPSDMKRWLKDALREAFQDLYGRSPDERAIRGWLESEDRSVAAEPLARILDGGTIQGVGHHSADAHFAAALENLQRALRRIYLTLASKKESGLSAVQVLGHAHIDWAWLWPVAETRRKVVRTAATQIALLEQYPEWRFGMSSPAMWQVLEGEPELWARWKRWVSCGRIEPLGAMWLEADCQMVDSEPFLRHLIMGLRYFQDKVQKRPSIAFLPDTFGFPAALPTIFSAAKIQLFLTTKINANDTNPFPYKQFQWMGPDGSVVPAMIFGSSPEDYNGLLTLEDLRAAHDNFVEAGGSKAVLYTFGHGDGGGGPDEGMLERLARYRQLPMVPSLTQVDFSALSEHAEGDRGWPPYRGELYLEFHRAIYTAQSAVKSSNRAQAADLVSAEVWATLADAPTNLQEAWTLHLQNHFHDILPGSSIKAVYEDFARDAQVIRAGVEGVQDASWEKLLAHGDRPALLVGHRGRFPRKTHSITVSRLRPFEIYWEDQWHRARVAGPDGYEVDVPTMAAWSLGVFPLRDLEPISQAEIASRLRQGLYSFQMERMEVVVGPEGVRSLRHEGRELLQEPAGISAFFQHPAEHDAWELVNPSDRRTVAARHDPVVVDYEDAHRAVLTLVHHFGHSTVVEQITLTDQEQLVTVRVRAELRDRHVVIAYNVPTSLRAQTVTRETLWGTDSLPSVPGSREDAARYEWCAHRWVDLSEAHHGLALFNDGRYGHHVDGSTLGVTLATSPLYPDPTADQSPSEVRLALVPHRRHWTEAHIMAKAHAFSEPPVVEECLMSGDQALWFTPLSGIPENIALLTLKRAEDGSGDWIYHFAEQWGDTVKWMAQWPRPVGRVAIADLVDETPGIWLPSSDWTTALELGPYQLLVVRVSLKT